MVKTMPRTHYIFIIFLCVGMIGCILKNQGSNRCNFNRKCKCYNLPYAYYKVDCSYRNITFVPSFPKITHHADVSHNLVDNVPDYRFQNNTELQILIMSYNLLKTLHKETFRGLYNLTILNLSNNNIGQIASDTFSYLRRLQFLDLKHNKINTLYLNFSSLTYLHTLRMDFIAKENESLPEGLGHLKTLDISGTSGNCDVNILTPYMFRLSSSIEDINLSACKINRVYNGTFRHMENLTIFDISFNPCLKFSGAENISYDLPYTSIKVFKINKIHKTFEMNTKLRVSHVRNLKSTNVTEIQIDSNRIQQIEKGAMKMLPNTIRSISMSDNEFSYGDYLWEIISLPVEHVDISELFKSHSLLQRDERCEHVDYQQDMDTEDDSTSQSTEQDTSDFHASIFSAEVIPFPYRLKTFVYRKCMLRYEIPPVRVSNNIVEYLDGRENLFYSLIGPIRRLDYVWYLDLSSNVCSNVSKVFFKGTPNLKVLRLQNNLLGFVLPDDKNGEVLEHIPKLEEINLSENRIPSLPFNFFKEQILLKRMYLSGNMLDGINFRVDHMTRLSILDLSNNRFFSLNEAARGQLNSISESQGNFSLDISGNPLKCTCDTIKFVKWLASTTIHLKNLHSYTCKLSDETKQSLSNPKRVCEYLEKHCSSYVSLIIGMTTLCILFITILVSGIAYRHRWKVRYIYYMVKRKYQTKNKNERSKSDKSYKYDAFISYEEQDQTFVHQKLLRKLENDYGLKLCIHKRDFLPGNDIDENITFAIHESRKIVVIMSQNYLESYWCMFEYNMARLESIYSRNKENILFLVFLSQISSKDLPLIVLELVQSQSYIEYPNDEFGDSVFWDKLSEVLA